MRPKIYSPEAVEAGQSFWSAVIVFDCCMVVCPVPILVSWSVGFATVDAKAGSLIIDDSAILGSIVTLKSGVEGIEIFSRQNRPFSLTNRIHWSAEGLWKAPNASGNYYSFRRSVRSDPVASRDLDGPVPSLLGRHRDRKDIIGRRLGGPETPGFQRQGDFQIDDQGRLLPTGIRLNDPDPDNSECIRRFVRSN